MRGVDLGMDGGTMYLSTSCKQLLSFYFYSGKTNAHVTWLSSPFLPTLLVRTLIGQQLTLVYIMRRLPAGQRQYQGVPFVFRTITLGNIVPRTRTVHGFGWFPNPASWQPAAARAPLLTAPSAPHQAETCRRFNEGRCRQPRCRYTHTCKEWAVACPHNNEGQKGTIRPAAKAQPNGLPAGPEPYTDFDAHCACSK
jgi:hypothetical protein